MRSVPRSAALSAGLIALSIQAAIAQDFMLLQGQDIPGHDFRTPIQDHSLQGITLNACQAACAASIYCKAFTFDVSSSWCFLKEAAGTVSPYPGAISGLKTSPTITATENDPASSVNIVAQIGHSEDLTSVAFAPDGRKIISAGRDGQVLLWDLQTGKLIRKFEEHESSPIVFTSYLADGRRIVSAEEKGKIKIWNVSTGQKLQELRTNGDGSTQFAHNGRYMIASIWGRSVERWDLETGQLLGVLNINLSNPLALSPDGRILLAEGSDHKLGVWDLSSGVLLRTLDQRPMGWSSGDISPDGRRAVRASGDVMKVWDIESGELKLLLHGHADSQIPAVAFSPDGKSIVTASTDKTITIWNATDGLHSRVLSDVVGIRLDAHVVAFSPDGKTVLSAGSDLRTLKIFDIETGNLLRVLGNVSAARVAAIAVSPNGRELFSAALKNGVLNKWDLESGKLVKSLRGHSDVVTSLAVSLDGRNLLSGGEDNTAKLWDIDTGTLLHSFPGHKSWVNSVAFSPDGHHAVSGGADNLILFWDLDTGKLVQSIASYQRVFSADGFQDMIWSLAFSPDGRVLSTGNADSTIKLWDVASGRLLRSLDSPGMTVWDQSFSVAFSPDGKTVLSGSGRDAVELWDVATGKRLQSLGGHLDTVRSVAFSPDGRTAVSGSTDNSVKLWDLGSGTLLRTFGSHSGAVSSVAFAPGGNLVISGGADGIITLSDAVTGDLRASMITFASGEWATVTPEGFFNASPEGAKELTVVRGLDVYSIDQVYQQLYRPDLVEEKLAGDPRGLVKQAAARLDLTGVIDSGQPPEIEITSPVDGYRIGADANEVTVTANITDRGGGIGKIEWRVNDLTLGIDHNRGLTKTTDGQTRSDSITLRRTLSLSPGNNKIEIVAYNSKNLVTSEPVRITVLRGATLLPNELPNLYILSVGIDDYWDGSLKLNYAREDAVAVGEGFKKSGVGLYAQAILTTVVDSDVTTTRLDQIFRDLSEKIRPQDVFVFYVAGHGKTQNGRFYFIPYDFRYDGEESFAKEGIDQERFQVWFSGIKANKSILLYDACESGTLTRGLERNTALDKLTRAIGRTIISAASEDGPALEGYRGHGLFAYVVLDAIGSADTNGDGLIDVNELISWVDDKVPDLSFSAFHQRQIPMRNVVGIDFPLVRKLTVLPVASTEDVVVPDRPTHVLIVATEARFGPDSSDNIVQELPAGALVTLLETKDGWSLVARGGKRVGYVQEKTLARMQ